MKRLAGALTTIGLAGCIAEGPTPAQNPPPVGDPTDTDRIYVADEDDGAISVIAAATHWRVATIPCDEIVDGKSMMNMVHNVQVAPDGKSVWVTANAMTADANGHADGGDEHAGGGGGQDQVIVIDPMTDQITARVPLGHELHLAHVVLDAESATVYVTATESNELIRLDAATRAVTARYALGEGRAPHGARVCAGSVWVAEMDGKAIAAVEPESGAIAEIPVGGVAVQVACTPDQAYVFGSVYDTREVVRIVTSDGTLAHFALPEGSQGPLQLYPSPDGVRIYVADQGVLLDRPASNRLYELDVTSGSVLATITVGQAAHGVVVSDDGSRVYVTNLLDATVSVIDAPTRAVLTTVGVGERPNGIAHWHATGGMP